MYGKLVTAMVTPFKENGDINYEVAKELVEHLINTGTDSLVILGTTGEAPTLDEKEKIKFVKYIKKILKGRIPLIVGVGTNNTKETVHFAKKIEKIWVDGFLVVAPYYNKPSQEGIYEHFKQISDAVRTPIMVYNIPGRSVVNIEYETLVKLAKLENVKAVKYSHNDLETVKKLIEHTDLYVYSGDDITTLDFVKLGAEGVVSVASHIIGPELREVIETENEKLMNKLSKIIKLLFAEPNPAPIKFALRQKGIDVGVPRLPLVDITDSLKEKIKKAMK